MENTKNQPGVVYDTSLEHALENMKTSNNFLRIEKRPIVDVFRSGTEIKKLGGSRVDIEGHE